MLTAADLQAGDLLWLRQPIVPGVGRNVLPRLNISVLAWEVLRVCRLLQAADLYGVGTLRMRLTEIDARLASGVVRLIRPTYRYP